MSDNLNEDLQKFEELEKILSEETEVKSDEEEGEVVEEAEEVVESESGDEGETVSDEDDSEVEVEEEAEEASSDDDEGESAEAESEDSEGESDEGDAEEVEEAEEAEEAEEVEEAEEDEDAEDSEDDSEEKSAEEDAVSSKAASIMARMASEEDQTDMPILWFKEADLLEAETDGAIITSLAYDDLDEDAKGAYEPIEVFEEVSGKGWGTRYRRISPLERNRERKETEEVVEEAVETVKDMFDTAEEAAERATALGCEGSHAHEGGKFMPCASMEEYQAIVSADAEKSEEFLCGQQRKSVQQPCDICRGGCAPEDGLPGLGDIEASVKSAYEGSEIIGSGYSNVDDMFVVDIKRADGPAIESFLSGDGQELGWLRLDEDLLDEKSLEGIEIVSKSDAEEVAQKAVQELELEGKVMGVMVDVFADEDVYVVEVETDQKSFDFFVSIDGKMLGYDEYEVELDTEISEEDEIKALEAELEIKRMYSREQREAMAESGEALPDGSFPIADQADLENAIAALPRAADAQATTAHIIKRAKELGLEELLPEGMTEEVSETVEEEVDEAGAEKAALDSEILSALEEFQSMKLEEGLS